MGLVVGVLMKKYLNVSLVDLPLSPYDIIIVFKNKDETEEIIRAQVKTATTSISFKGGSRGGADRIYKSDVKTYTQSPKTSDVVIGITPKEGNNYDLYFFPTLLIEKINQGSISINRIPYLKNNFEILEKCKNKKFILEYAKINNLIM